MIKKSSVLGTIHMDRGGEHGQRLLVMRGIDDTHCHIEAWFKNGEIDGVTLTLDEAREAGEALLAACAPADKHK